MGDESRYASSVRRERPDAPHDSGQPARRTRSGGASDALHGLALQERENILARTVLATGNMRMSDDLYIQTSKCDF